MEKEKKTKIIFFIIFLGNRLGSNLGNWEGIGLEKVSGDGKGNV